MRVKSIKYHVRRFYRDEEGILLAEFLVLLPLMIWAYLAFVVFWDAFASINKAQKATYAISDAISRTSNTVNVAGLNTYVPVMRYLLGNPSIANTARIRITSFQWDERNTQYVVLFSYSPGNQMRPLVAADLTAIEDSIPLMADLDSLVMVESQVDYSPILRGGTIRGSSHDGRDPSNPPGWISFMVPSQTIHNRVFERPRFVRRVCMDTGFSCPATM